MLWYTAAVHTDDFTGWLKGEIEARYWTYNELARQSGLSSAMVSMVMTGQRLPGPDFCTGVAKALQLPPVEVFQRAGLLPPAPDLDDPQLKAALFLFEKLTVADQERVLAIMKALACVAKGEEEEEER